MRGQGACSATPGRGRGRRDHLLVAEEMGETAALAPHLGVCLRPWSPSCSSCWSWASPSAELAAGQVGATFLHPSRPRDIT